jgi:uncharacterized protein (TIGR02466 family)
MTPHLESRYQDADVLRMFPSFVWKATLRPEVCAPINDSILAALAAIGAPLADLKSGESWQSEQRLHELEQLRDLVDCINDATQSVLDYLKIRHGGFGITGCWADLSAPGAGHRAHSHPNNYLSGVYYLRTHPDANTINFLDPRQQAAIIRPPVTALTGENTEQVVVQVRDGTLLLFPAWLRHSVDANRSCRLRISLGFNVMFTQYAETMAQPLWMPGSRPSMS